MRVTAEPNIVAPAPKDRPLGLFPTSSKRSIASQTAHSKALHAIILLLFIYSAPLLRAAVANVRVIGLSSSYGAHNATSIATELNSIFAGASGYTGSSASASVLSGRSLTEAYYHPSYRTATRAALAESYTHLVILPETFWLSVYPEMTFDGVYQMGRKAFGQGATPLLLMPGTGTSSNITTLGTNSYRIGNGCGIHIVPGGYAAQSASLIDPSTTTNQARQAYLLAATIFTKITGLNASTGSTYIPSVSSPSTLASTAVTTVNTHNTTVHYTTSRENSGLVRYRTITPANNSLRYAKTGTSTEQGISNALTPIYQASGYSVNLYSISSDWGWTDAMATSAATNFATNANQYILAYVRSPFVSAQSTTMTSPNQANLLPICYDQQYTGMSTTNTLDDIYGLTEEARGQCASYGFATVPIHLGAARFNDIDSTIALSSDGTHWTSPFLNMIASMMATSSLGREPTPTSAILADSQLLTGFNLGKQTVRQLAFLSETESHVPDTALSIVTPSQLTAVQGLAFGYTFSATNGTTPYTWSVVSTTQLPAGLALSPNGGLSGIATAAPGQWQLIIQVKDSTGAIRKMPVTLSVASTGSGAGTLAMTSTESLNAFGNAGGPFSPASQTYTLSNAGTTSINWTASKTQGWITISATSGTLAAGASTTVTVSINNTADGLAANSYNDTVTFTNTTNSNGNTTRAVSLTVASLTANSTWDANGTTAGQTDGAGAWLAASQWWNGSTNANWTSAQSATFGNGGAGGAVTLAGPTTVNVLGFNGFTGTYTLGSADQTITLNGGITMNAAAGSVALASPLSLSYPQTWANHSANTLTASAAIKGSGNLVKAGTGSVVLAPSSDNSDYSGTTTVASGVLNIQKSTALGSEYSGTTVASGATLQLQGSISVGAEPLTLEGTGVSNTGALRNISGTNLYDGLMALNGATRIQSDAGTLVLTNTGTITGPSAALTAAGAGSITIMGNIATTTGSLTKEGTGTLTLFGANTYSGGTTINGGNITLATNATDSLGAANSSVTVNTSTTLTATGNTTLQKSFAINNSSILTFANSTSHITVTGAVTGNGGVRPVGGASSLGQRITTLSSTSNSFTGPISNPAGSNFADLSLNSLYDGTGAGNITFGEAGQARTMRVALGSGATSPLVLNTRQLIITGTTPTANLSNSSGQTLTVNTNLVNNSTGAATFELSGWGSGSNRFVGNITNGTGTLGLTKGGGGTWALSGTNTYTGNTVNAFSNPAGVLIFQGMQALPSNTALHQTHGGGTGGHAVIRLLDDSATPASRTGVNMAMFSSTGNQTMTLFVGNNSTANGGTSSSTQTGSTIALGNLNITQSSTGNVSQGLAVTGANGYRLQINNISPTLQAAATTWTATLNPTSAPLTVTGNVQQVGNASAGSMTLSLDGTASSNVISGTILNSADATPKALSLTKNNTSTWILAGANTYTGATTINNGTLQLGDGTAGKDGSIENTSAITNNGTLVFNRFGDVSSSVAIGGTGAVTKTGPGSQTLAGVNTYSGTTMVSAGKLLVDGSLSNVAAAINVNNGATLGGIGTIGRNVTIAAGGKLEFNISTPAASHDALDISTGRSFGFAGASEVIITSSGAPEPGTYTLVTGGNNITGTVPTVSLPAGWVGTVSISGNSLLLNVTTVPGTSVGSLTLDPGNVFSSTGSVGGPFAPNSIDYTLSNPTATSVNWTAAKTAGWVGLSSSGGTVAPGASVTVTVSINNNANALAVGSYNDTVTFSDTTNGGSSTRNVVLTITPAPYPVSYNGNGNTGGTAPSSQLKTHDVGLVLSGPGTLVRSGYNFTGWNTAANGSGTAYAAGAIYTDNAATTLYAQWNGTPVADAGADQSVARTGTSWSPAELSPQLWLDATTATINAGTVSIANAGSGGGTISGPASLSANGINALQAVSFSGSSQYITGNYTNTGTTLTAFFVGRSSSSTQTAYAGMMDVWASGQASDWNNIGSAVLFNQNNTTANSIYSYRNAALSSATGTLTSPFLAATVFNGSTNTLFLNGTSANSVNSTGNFNTAKVALGGRWASSVFGNFWNGNLGEAIICNASLSASDRQKVEGYLAHKWGLAANLPAEHPYKAQSPSTLGAIANLDGTVSDLDGDPLTNNWTVISGPGSVSFGDANAVDTTATFTVDGTYTLRLSVNDSFGSSYDECVINVGSATSNYTVTYDGNGNTGGAEPVDGNSPYAAGATVTVLGNTGSLTKPGCTFAGWNTAANGSGSAYTPGATFSMPAANTTLYAQWTANSYTVTFNANGGTAANPLTKSVTFGSAYGTLATTNRTGYSFNGWFSSASGGTEITAAANVATAENHTLYAQWTQLAVAVVTDTDTVIVPEGGTQSFQVKLSAQPSTSVTVIVSSTAGDPDITVQSGSSLTFTTASWDTYQTVTLAAANDADAGNGSATITCDVSNAAYTDKNITANEVDKHTTLTVTSDGNGATVPSGAVIVEKNAVTAIAATANTGYDFVNWTQTSGTANFADANSASTTAAITAPATIRANFTPKTYPVTYSGNGHTGGTAPADQSKLHDTDLTLRTNSGNLVKTGFVFAGWNTATDGSGTNHAAGSTYTANAPLTLYAKWVTDGGGTWLPTAAGPFNWGDSANWIDSIVASGADKTASFTSNITADQVANLEAARTIGNILFTDSATSSHNLTISGANNLTLDRTSGVPVVDVTQADRNLTISSIVAGTDGLQKSGSGTLTLSGNNTYTGTTTISAGTLRLEGNAFRTTARNYSISSGAVLHQAGSSQTPLGTTTISGSGTLRGSLINGTGAGYNLNLSLSAGGLIDIPSGGTIYNGGWQAMTWSSNQATLNVDGSLSIVDGQAITADALTGVGTITSANSGATAANFTLGVANGSGSYSGAISAAGTRVISLVKNGTGTQTFSGSTTWRGTTTINGGTLQYAKTSSLYAGVTTDWVKTKVIVNNGGTIAFNVGGTDEFTTGNVTTLLTGLGGAVNNNGLRAGSTIAFDTSNASGTFTMANTIANTTGTGGGAVGLKKLGTGTLALSGPNSYTGSTTISGGTLLITGNQTAATGAVSVANGATLGGTGSIGGNVTIADGGKLEFNLSTSAGSHDDLAIATGKSLGFAGNSELTITSGGGAAPGTYTLITGGNNITGLAPTIVNLPNGWVANVAISGNSLLLNVVSTAGDATPPTLAGITDDKGGSAIIANTPVNYTVTFSEDIDVLAVTAADFGNAGTAAVAIGTITETADGIFLVQVMPVSAGSLQFQINAGAAITDASGNPLDTTSALADDTIITVSPANTAPVATAQNVATDEDQAKAITLSATDAQGDPLTYAVVSAPANGTLSGTPPNVIYTPAANYNGSDSFTFKANDGALDSAVATVSITVSSLNDAPVAVSQSVTTAEDNAKAITLVGTDVDLNPLTYAIVTGPTKGTLSGTAPNLTYTPSLDANGADSFTYKVNDGTVDSTVATVSITVTSVNDAPVAVAQSVTTAEDTAKAITLSGTDVDLNPLTYAVVTAPTKGTLSGTAPNLTYTPSLNANGTDSFTFKVNDGTVDSAVATVSITITAANDTPVAVAQSVTTAEDIAKAITLTGTDVENSPLTYAIVSPPASGTLSGTAPNLTYTPPTNFTGSVSFTFKVNDGTVDSAVATVSITVTAVNDAPVAVAQSVTTAEDTALPITLTGTDAENSALTYSIVSQPANGTLSGTAPNVTYTPAANFNGADSFTFKVNDGTVDSAVATVSITVTAANDTPVFAANPIVAAEANEGVAYTGQTLAGKATDPDQGDTITYSKVSGPEWLTVDANGALGGTPPSGSAGLNSFVVRATDSTSATADATLEVTVTGLPLPWVTTDIGTGMLAGSVTHNAGTFTQAGSGVIGSTSDKLRFTYQTLTGDGEITARISALQDTGNSSRVGVMIRDSLAPDSKEFFMGMTGTNAYRWARRTTTGGSTSVSNNNTGTIPNTWVRVVRSGTTISAYKSTNGTTWINVGSTLNTTFGSTCYIGLAVGSGSDTTINTSQFSNVSVTP